MRGAFIATFHESGHRELAYGERLIQTRDMPDSGSPASSYPLDQSPIPTRAYPFLNAHELTADLDTTKLVKHDMVDQERRPVTLELHTELLELIAKNINYVFEQKKLSPHVDLEKLVAGKVEAIARQLRPELVKEAAGVHVAAELLDYQFEEAQIRRARMAGIEVSAIGWLERNAERPGDTLRHDFAIWNEAEWENAREEAVDLMLDYVDPRFSVEFQVFAGREIESEVPEVAARQETHGLRDFGKGVLRRLVRVVA